MALITSEDGTYDYVDATVEEDGIHLEYKVSELAIVGSDIIDEPGAMGWSEADVRRIVADYLEIIDGAKLIDITF